MIGESSRSVKGSQYFKCQDYDHNAAQCPSRNLLIKKIDDYIETVIHEAIGDATDSEDDLRVSSIQLGVSRCPYTTVGNEDWRKSSVFIPILHMREGTIN